LAQRVVAILDWTAAEPGLAGLPVGLFGASTGAAAALEAAIAQPHRVGAVVSRGGRPDLVQSLPDVRCPTLLLVGGRDDVVLRLNQEAQRRMTGAVSELVVIPGATHLFEEPGALEEVGRLAAGWFRSHLGGPG
jgi:putative phosphoribosyl transferase